jgi:P-type conjugative transfer protein TrbJ
MVGALREGVRKGTAVAAIAGLLLIGQPQPAHASAIVGATEITQLLNHVELILQYEQQVQQYITQFKQFENELKQAAMLPQQFMNLTHSQMVGLANVVGKGHALAYNMSNFDDVFTSKFSSIGYTPTQNFSQRYQTWSQTSHDSVQGALDAVNLQSSDMNDEENIIDSLQSQAQTADGQMQAVQVGNQIAAAEADQLIKLRQLMMSDMQAKYAYQQQQQQQQDEQQKSMGMFQNSTVFINNGGIHGTSGGSGSSNNTTSGSN